MASACSVAAVVSVVSIAISVLVPTLILVVVAAIRGEGSIHSLAEVFLFPYNDRRSIILLVVCIGLYSHSRLFAVSRSLPRSLLYTRHGWFRWYIYM